LDITQALLKTTTLINVHVNNKFSNQAYVSNTI